MQISCLMLSFSEALLQVRSEVAAHQIRQSVAAAGRDAVFDDAFPIRAHRATRHLVDAVAGLIRPTVRQLTPNCFAT
jgi:hypothetical protein